MDKEKIIGFNPNKPAGKRFDLVDAEQTPQDIEKMTQFFTFNIQSETLSPISEADFNKAIKFQPEKNVFVTKITDGKIVDLIHPKNAILDKNNLDEIKQMIEQRIMN